MTFRSRILFILFSIVCCAGLIYQWIDHNKSVDDYDLPKELSGKKQIVDLRHVERNCDCADWVEADRFKDSSKLSEKDYLFIEPASAGLDPPASYWALADSGYILRVHGEFYKGEAIPYMYIQKTDQKPEKARVFYYTSFEVVKPNSSR